MRESVQNIELPGHKKKTEFTTQTKGVPKNSLDFSVILTCRKNTILLFFFYLRFTNYLNLQLVKNVMYET